MSSKDDLKNLIIKHNRRLFKLKEQIAVSGMSVDPKILIEAEDIEAEIQDLQAELETLAEAEEEAAPPVDRPSAAAQKPAPRGDNITIGAMTGDKNFAVGSGSTVKINQGRESSERDRAAASFRPVYRQIELRCAGDNEAGAALTRPVVRIEQETAKGRRANLAKIERWLRSLVRTAPDIFEMTAACLLTAPTLPPEIGQVVDRARANSEQ